MKGLSVELSAGATPAPLPKVPTGIAGVDEVLIGGLPCGGTTLLTGGPGSGKTVLALEFLYRGALSGEPAVFITFEEEAESLRRNALTLGWDLASLEKNGKLALMHADIPADMVRAGDFDLRGFLAVAEGQIKRLGARRLVVDALDILLRVFGDGSQNQENQLFLFHNWLLKQEQTTVLTVKSAGDGLARQRLEHMTDCVLQLDHRVLGQVSTRRIRVLKYRGSGFMSNEYPYVIGTGGIVLMPISTAHLPDQPVGARFPTGVPGLDPLLSGGFHRGSCVLIAGSTGTGKTTLALSIAVAACRRGERTLYISFEESAESLGHSSRSTGMDLVSAIESGELEILTAMPEAMGVEEHLWQILEVIQRFRPMHVVVDAISACRRMASETVAFDFLVRLLSQCKSRGITCLYINQIDPGQTGQSITGVGISSLVDALLLLEQSWSGGSYRRELLIVKFRGGPHSHAHHSFEISADGLVVSEAAGPDSQREGA